MEIAIKEISDLTEIELKIDNLKVARTGIEEQLRKTHGGAVETDSLDEGLVKKFLGSMYRGGAPPRSTKPSREALQAEADAINESLDRLRLSRKEAQVQWATDETARLMPSYRAAAIALKEAVDEAMRRNEALLTIERNIPTHRPCGLGWDVLGQVGWSYGTSLKNWQTRMEGFLSREKE